MPRLVLLAFLIFSCSAGNEVRVFAAASLTDALEEIAETYRQKGGGRAVFNFASSSALARQIAAGAPADLFVSADEAKMDWLAERNLIADETRVRLLSNTLAIVVPRHSTIVISHPRDLTALRSIALAEPASVPAGIYAKAYLEEVGLWDAVASRIIPTDNVRSALYAVEGGNADAAIVYTTDVRVSKRVRLAYEMEGGPAISYPAAVTAGAERPDEARRFLSFLRSKDAAEVFRRYGFVVVTGGPSPARGRGWREAPGEGD